MYFDIQIHRRSMPIVSSHVRNIAHVGRKCGVLWETAGLFIVGVVAVWSAASLLIAEQRALRGSRLHGNDAGESESNFAKTLGKPSETSETW